MATLLIAKSDFADYGDISTNITTAKINPFILAAQKHDLRPILYRDFYDAIITEAAGAASASWYTDILAYIKPVLVYYTYARWIEEGHIHDTKTGPVLKNNPHSTPESDKSRASRAAKKRSQAADYVEDMIRFLDDNRSVTEYDDYHNNTPAANKRRGGITISSTFE